MNLNFIPITPEAHSIISAAVQQAHLSNCNYSLSNLCSWSELFHTHVAYTDQGVVVRYNGFLGLAYALIVPADSPTLTCIIDSLRHDAATMGQPLHLVGIETALFQKLQSLYSSDIIFEERRSQNDYIYLRSDLALLQGKNYHGKRNHTNKFRTLFPHYRYEELAPRHFAQGMDLASRGALAAAKNDDVEQQSMHHERVSMQYVFDHWHLLHNIGGCLMVDDRMVAFTYGGAITPSLFDTCVEKADLDYPGAYAVINQELAIHLPPQFTHINREEDMGLEGLRKAKLSYHPAVLLPYYAATFAGAPI